ncbi:hypothetical protein TNCV_4700351 [Trichonephila clavipes]|nr:hypothetical protein TNCV_4700351 [Trichonephila clavipes]
MGLRSRRPTRVSLLTAQHKALRLAWASQPRHWTIDDWNHVAWYDFFTIDGDITDLHLPNLGMKLEGREIFSSPHALVVSAATAHKTFGPTDLTSTYPVYPWRVFGASNPGLLVGNPMFQPLV